MTIQGGKNGLPAGASKAGAPPASLAAGASKAGDGALGAVSRLSALLEAARARLALHATAAELDGLAGDLDRARRELGAVSAMDMTGEERLGMVRAAGEARARLAVLAKLAHGSARFASLVRELDPASRSPALYGRDGGATVGGRKSGNGRGGIERKA